MKYLYKIAIISIAILALIQPFDGFGRTRADSYILPPDSINFINSQTTFTEPLGGKILVKQDNITFNTRKWQGIPSIGIDNRGVLYAVWYSGMSTEEAGNYVTVSTSTDNGKTWKKNDLIINPTSPGVRFFDAVFWNDKYGNLYLSWTKSTGTTTNWDGKGGVWLSRIKLSQDSIIYTSPKRIADGVMMNKPITYNNSLSMLFPISVWLDGAVTPSNTGAFTYKGNYDDNAKNITGFQKTGAINILNSLRVFDEHQIVELKDKSLLAFLRTNNGIYSSKSIDGITWTPAVKFTSVGVTASSRFHLSRLISGRIALVLNNNIDRKDLKIFLSEDEGTTWKGVLLIDERLGVSYPDLVQSADGRIYITYDFDRYGVGHILLASMTENDILNNRPQNITKAIVDFLNKSQPVIASGQSFSVNENVAVGTAVGTVSAADADAKTTFQNWTIISGNNGNAFAIDAATGVISVKGNLDYESKTSYALVITVSDGLNTSIAQTINIIINNLNDNKPVISSGQKFNIDENSTAGTVIGKVTATDADGITTFQNWTITAGNTANAFSLNSTTGAITVAGTLDFETKASYTLTLSVTDGVNTSASENITININNLNDNKPVISSGQKFNIDENSAAGTVIGKVTATDADGTTTFQNWSITAGNTANTFSINTLTGIITVNGPLDFETKASYTLTLSVTDGVNTSAPENITININNLNDNKPVITADQLFNINENAITGTNVGTLKASDADGPTTFNNWTITAGNTGNAFSLNSATGAITVTGPLDFETKTSYTLTITVSDGVNTSNTQNIIININNLNDNIPFIIPGQSFSISENIAPGIIGTVAATDRDGQSTLQNWTIISGNTGNAFSINSSTGAISVNVSPDFETRNSYTLILTVSDGTNISAQQNLTIAVTDVNEAPTNIAISKSDINENNSAGAAIGNFSSDDPDIGSVFNYSLADGTGSTDNTAFYINGNTLTALREFDFEKQTSFSIRVRTTDNGGLSFEKIFKININNVKEAPTSLALTQQPAPATNVSDATIGILSATSPDANPAFSYALVPGSGDTDNALFRINGAELKLLTPFDPDLKNIYKVRVRAMVSPELWAEKSFTITLVKTTNPLRTTILFTNINENKPVVVPGQFFFSNENVPLNTLIGYIKATDKDGLTTYSNWTITAGNADSKFSLDPATGAIRVNGSLDYESKSTYPLTVTVSDGTNTSNPQELTVFLKDSNEAPTDILLSASAIKEHNLPRAIIGRISSSDPDALSKFTYSLAAGPGDTDNALFAIEGEDLTALKTFDFEAKNSYSIRIRTTDNGGLTFEKPFTITIIDVIEAPVTLLLSKSDIDENQPSGTLVGTLLGSAPDVNSSLSYSLTEGEGAADNASFIITNNELRTRIPFNYELKKTYSIRTRVTNRLGPYLEQIFSITVNDRNENPTNILLSADGIQENNPLGALVATLSSADPDAGSTFSYSLASGEGSKDNAAFSITGTELNALQSFDFEMQPSYSIRIRSTDSGGLSFEKSFVIAVYDIPEPPTLLSLSRLDINENNAPRAIIGDLSSVSPTKGTTFVYTLVNGTGDPDNALFDIIDNRIIARQSFNYEVKNTYTVRIRTTDSNGLKLEDSFLITINDVNERPTLDAVSNQRACIINSTQAIPVSGVSTGPESNQALTVTVSTDRPELFSSLAYVPGSTGTTGTIAYLVNSNNNPGIATITLTAKDNGGTLNGGEDTFSISFTLTLISPPVVSIISDKGTEFSKGLSAKLTASGGSSYVWTTADGIIDGINTATLTVRPSQNTTYTVTAFNEAGCSVSQSITLNPTEDYQVITATNILSPNGDGKNDKWVVRNIDMYPGNMVKVFDRAGKLVFSTENYKNDWDGTFHGNTLNTGTYYYFIDFGIGKKFIKKGFITIIRN